MYERYRSMFGRGYKSDLDESDSELSSDDNGCYSDIPLSLCRRCYAGKGAVDGSAGGADAKEGLAELEGSSKF
jgi:hypothetical protein